MWKLEIKYSNGQTVLTKFSEKKDAIWFLHNEGDHVSGFTLKEVKDENTESNGNSCEKA